MRGRTDEQPALFHSFNVEDRIRADHPLWDVKRRTDRILASLSGEFARKRSQDAIRPTLDIPQRMVRPNAILDVETVEQRRLFVGPTPHGKSPGDEPRIAPSNRGINREFFNTLLGCLRRAESSRHDAFPEG